MCLLQVVFHWNPLIHNKLHEISGRVCYRLLLFSEMSLVVLVDYCLLITIFRRILELNFISWLSSCKLFVGQNENWTSNDCLPVTEVSNLSTEEHNGKAVEQLFHLCGAVLHGDNNNKSCYSCSCFLQTAYSSINVTKNHTSYASMPLE